MDFDRNTLLLLLVIAFSIVIVLMVVKILIKFRKGPKAKKKKEPRVLEAVSSSPDSDAIFNSIVSTKRIASDLKRRGIDVSKAKELINEADFEYEQGKVGKAKFHIEEAKELLLRSKREWDEKTGFDVVPSTSSAQPKTGFRETVDLVAEENLKTPEEEIPELKGALETKPDNYLPSKFTISLAQTAIENASNADADVGEAQRILMDAKACFAREDYDGAFKLALDCKRVAEECLGVAPEGEKKEKVLSDLATASTEVEEMKICSICGERKIPYVCIEVKDGEEATCKECYEISVGRITKAELSAPAAAHEKAEEIKEEKAEEKPEEKKKAEEKKEEIEEEEQHYCPNCGAKVKAEDVFCGKCGKPVKEELKCVGCGTKVEPGDVFCRKCGARLVT